MHNLQTVSQHDDKILTDHWKDGHEPDFLQTYKISSKSLSYLENIKLFISYHVCHKCSLSFYTILDYR
ncbi:hypothetical protein XBO1_1300103 [Xenorhabdus bovienii str. oregonense]|uniref:Uncharacterized protein n=1 Tax=Xenorhabdus bovienii str. oregonense TaxID=1398202 RepID=A0A077P131_XENBV|nr:hypothetical protein XBO1_1300103 [Xenorhabdus bovienii str. oregonense]